MEPLPEKNIDSIFEEYDVDDVRTPMNNASEASLPTQPMYIKVMYKARAALFTNVTQSKPFTSHSDGDQVNKSKPFSSHRESTKVPLLRFLSGQNNPFGPLRDPNDYVRTTR